MDFFKIGCLYSVTASYSRLANRACAWRMADAVTGTGSSLAAGVFFFFFGLGGVGGRSATDPCSSVALSSAAAAVGNSFSSLAWLS